MNLKQITLLTGLSIASVLGTGALVPANAVTLNYVFTNTMFNDNGTLNGTFNYNDVAKSYSDFNFTVAGGSLTPFTYTPANSNLVASMFGTESNGFRVAVASLPPGVTARSLRITFADVLTNTAGSTAILPGISTDDFFPSRERTSTGPSGTTLSFRGINTGASVTTNAVPVPWETDSLPILGTTVMFGAAVFAKRKLAKSSIKNLNVEAECVSVNA